MTSIYSWSARWQPGVYVYVYRLLSQLPFSSWIWLCQFCFGFLPRLVWEENLLELVADVFKVFFMEKVLFLSPSSIRLWKEAHSPRPSQWHSLVLRSFTTGLLVEANCFFILTPSVMPVPVGCMYMCCLLRCNYCLAQLEDGGRDDAHWQRHGHGCHPVWLGTIYQVCRLRPGLLNCSLQD